jgi:hypothetical protein
MAGRRRIVRNATGIGLAISFWKTIIPIRMDWFAINESSAAFGTYTQLAKVAAHTALTHTSLRPCMLYGYEYENSFTRWMRRRGVDIIFAESYLKKDLQIEWVDKSGAWLASPKAPGMNPP